MIVCHTHRFIFLKTEKTAGTSLESVLAELCGPDDIVSGARRDPVTRKPKARNNALGLGRYLKVPAEITRRFPALGGFYPHMPARQVKALVGPDVWRSYFKFAVERNPWDRQVSNYFHRQSRQSTKQDFERYITSPLYRHLHHVRLDNWGIYTIGGEIAVDRVLRYESLEEDCARLFADLGLAGDLSDRWARAQHRPDGTDYRSFYNDRTIRIVGRWYAREIEAFGYEF